MSDPSTSGGIDLVGDFKLPLPISEITATSTSADNSNNDDDGHERKNKATDSSQINESKYNPNVQTKKRSRMEAKTHEPHPIFMSVFALEIYAIVLLSIWTQKYWVLHGVTLLILAHIADILVAWFLHVKGAKEIREFKTWLVWWTKIGLHFAIDTVEGSVVNRILVANTLHFWNKIGKSYTTHWFDDIAKKSRKNVLNRAKEQLEQATSTQKRFASEFREGLAKLQLTSR